MARVGESCSGWNGGRTVEQRSCPRRVIMSVWDRDISVSAVNIAARTCSSFFRFIGTRANQHNGGGEEFTSSVSFLSRENSSRFLTQSRTCSPMSLMKRCVYGRPHLLRAVCVPRLCVLLYLSGMRYLMYKFAFFRKNNTLWWYSLFLRGRHCFNLYRMQVGAEKIPEKRNIFAEERALYKIYLFIRNISHTSLWSLLYI